MPDPVTGVIAGGSLLVGAYSADKQAKAAKDAAKTQAQAMDRQLAFEQQKYAEQQAKWDATYGSVEQNLSDYYSNLSPDYYAVQGLEAFQLEQEQALTATRETLAQRGLATSGTAAAAEIAAGAQQATQRATIRTAAQQEVRNQQLNFLSTGMGNQPNYGGISNALATQSQAAANERIAADQRAAQSAQAFGQALGSTAYLAASQPTGLSQSNNPIQTDMYGRVAGGV